MVQFYRCLLCFLLARNRLLHQSPARESHLSTFQLFPVPLMPKPFSQGDLAEQTAAQDLPRVETNGGIFLPSKPALNLHTKAIFFKQISNITRWFSGQRLSFFSPRNIGWIIDKLLCDRIWSLKKLFIVKCHFLSMKTSVTLHALFLRRFNLENWPVELLFFYY